MSARRRRSSRGHGLLLAAAGLNAGCVMPSVLGEFDSAEATTDSATESMTGFTSSDEPDSNTSGASLDGGSTSGGSTNDGGSTSGGSTSEGGLEDSTSGGSQVDEGTWEVPPQCAAVASESAYCLTAGWNGYHLIGVDSGEFCTMGPANIPLFSPSLAWQGMSIVTCGGDGDHVFARHHLLDGTFEVTDIECRAVTSIGDRLLVESGIPLPGQTLEIYEDFEALAAQNPSEDLGFGIQGSRMWTDGETIVDAWHSTETLWRHTLSGDPLPDLPLEDHDGWINGMFIIDDVLMILTNGPGQNDLLLKFDPQTGAALETVVLEGLVAPTGLRCRPGTGG